MENSAPEKRVCIQDPQIKRHLRTRQVRGYHIRERDGPAPRGHRHPWALCSLPQPKGSTFPTSKVRRRSVRFLANTGGSLRTKGPGVVRTRLLSQGGQDSTCTGGRRQQDTGRAALRQACFRNKEMGCREWNWEQCQGQGRGVSPPVGLQVPGRPPPSLDIPSP